MVVWSRSWKSSKKAKKQRKYRYNAPLHIKKKFVGSHLSKELRERYKTRSMSIVKGDKVKVVRGQFKGHTGKVEEVNIRKCKIFIAGIEIQKKDGSKTSCPINPSNVSIIELNLEDKKRNQIIERRK